ncbi:MAG: hypothetical protein ACOY3V_03485 [Pseudomonadota bacterium]
MKNVHLVIADLFLPQDIAAEVIAGLHLPALEGMLSRGRGMVGPAHALESHLLSLFGLPEQGAVAAWGASFDGLPAAAPDAVWLRADPAYVQLQRERMVLLPNPDIDSAEAAQLAGGLNDYFSGLGMTFFAPHPQRWYLQVERLPDIRTTPLSLALGRDMRELLPQGNEAQRWHRLCNEVQMFLFDHPVNQAREACGKLPINSLWFWGEGRAVGQPQKNYARVCSDEVLAAMLAAAAEIPFAGWATQWHTPDDGVDGQTQLLWWRGLRTVLQQGDLNAWRNALENFEAAYAQPLWQALCRGEIGQLRMDILGSDGMRCVQLKRGDTWAIWRRRKRLSAYSMV